MKAKLEKVQAQKSRGLVGGLLAICLVAVLGFGVAVFAFSSIGISNTFTGEVTINQSAEQLGDAAFGSAGPTATITPELLAGFTDVNVSNSFRMGDGNTFKAEGITSYLRTIDCSDATTTAAVFTNTFGEPIYVDTSRTGLKSIANATDTVSIFYTTSTALFISGDNPGDLYKLFATQLTRIATTSIRMMSEESLNGTSYNATAERVNSFKLQPDERLLFIATSTSAGTRNGPIVESGNLFDCRAYVSFYTVD